MKSTLEMIAEIISRLPDGADEARAFRRRIVAAGDETDGDTQGLGGEINSTVMALFSHIGTTDTADIDPGPSAGDLFADANGDKGADEVDEASGTPTVQFSPASGENDVTERADVAAEQQAADVQASQIPNPDQSAPESVAAAEPVAVPEPAPAAAPVAAAQPEPAPAPATGIPKWTDREKLLYRDIIHLFELGDQIGAMASLERVYMLAPGAVELNVFLGKNENTLLKLYRDHIGSMDRVTLPSRARKTVRIPTPDPDLMLKIIRLSDGHRPIKEFVKKLDASELHILMVISHLARSGYLEIA